MVHVLVKASGLPVGAEILSGQDGDRLEFDLVMAGNLSEPSGLPADRTHDAESITNPPEFRDDQR